LTQSQVEQKLKDNATRDAVFNIGLNSPNLLAYSFFGTNNSLPSTTTVPTPVIETTTTTIAPQPVIVTTTTLAPQPVSTTTTFVPSSPTTVQIDLTCFKPAERTRFFNVPYVCVNTGNQLMWIPQRYSPGRP
jgi:hypothetical protein